MTTPQTRAEAKARATTTPNKWIPSPAARLWLYGVLVALSAAGIGYGVLTIEQGGLWLSLAAAVLGVGNAVAARNVPK
ncbi:hypothetical protein [Microbacterium sp. cx-55]|uniref:phage holin n=1 Tax=Microbacterium sp. cx-55 TaxID=2875948 RepID=UPI001CC1B3D7|nr:hypothetical protein [Microbacterium sp. cx-55]MBZ4486288.1 hypothetical protein [Microbacterium sp. cx-55]